MTICTACAPHSVASHREGEAEIFLLSAKEGGRTTSFGNGYAPQFFFGTTDVTGTILVDGGGVIHPGERAKIAFSLFKPVGVEKGMRFAMREGSRTIGAGIVSLVK